MFTTHQNTPSKVFFVILHLTDPSNIGKLVGKLTASAEGNLTVGARGKILSICNRYGNLSTKNASILILYIGSIFPLAPTAKLPDVVYLPDVAYLPGSYMS